MVSEGIALISISFQINDIEVFGVNSVFYVTGGDFGGTRIARGKIEKKLNILYFSEWVEIGLFDQTATYKLKK